MLSTIALPKNLFNLKKNLPKANYKKRGPRIVKNIEKIVEER